MKRIQDEGSDDEQVDDDLNREQIGEQLFGGSDDVSKYFIVSMNFDNFLPNITLFSLKICFNNARTKIMLIKGYINALKLMKYLNICDLKLLFFHILADKSYFKQLAHYSCPCESSKVLR